MNIREYIDKELNDIDIEKLRLWNIDTSDEGVIMPDYYSFVDKILIISKLCKQKEDDRINYLFGMGVGIELALQGNVIGRCKNNNCYPYRPHSEIYLYNVDNKNIEFYNSNLFKVFNKCKILNKDKTYMLNGLSNDLLDNNYDMVMINNHKVLIPCLEILFLDSYLSGGMDKRVEGYDYQLLIREYKLDVDKIINYLENYYVNYLIDNFDSKYDNLVEEQISAIERILNTGKRADRSLFNLEEQISSYPTGNNLKYAGIYVDLWIPLDVDSVVYKNGGYKIIDNKYIEKLKSRVRLYKENEMQRYEEIAIKIKKMIEGSDVE